MQMALEEPVKLEKTPEEVIKEVGAELVEIKDKLQSIETGSPAQIG